MFRLWRPYIHSDAGRLEALISRMPAHGEGFAGSERAAGRAGAGEEGRHVVEA
jgi:hypothetical protein